MESKSDPKKCHFLLSILSIILVSEQKKENANKPNNLKTDNKDNKS